MSRHSTQNSSATLCNRALSSVLNGSKPCEINAMWDSWQPHRKIMSSHLSVITSRLLQMCCTERERCLSVKWWSRRGFPHRSITAPRTLRIDRQKIKERSSEKRKKKRLYLVDRFFFFCWLEKTRRWFGFCWETAGAMTPKCFVTKVTASDLFGGKVFNSPPDLRLFSEI